MGAAPRKQNSSCDQCRRSKRRCAFPPDVQPGTSATCLNCLHFGRDCTYEFVSSRLSHRRTKTSSPPVPLQESTIAQDADSPQDRRAIDAVTSSHDEFDESVPAQTAWPPFPDHGLPGVNMFLENLASEWAQLMTGERVPVDNATDCTESTIVESAALKGANGARRWSGGSPAHPKGLLGSWRGSPIHLLNSSMELHLVNQNLGDIYGCMMSGIATRYLDYNCNLFAGSYRYSFDVECADVPGSRKGTDHFLARTYTPAWKRSSSTAQAVAVPDPAYSLDDLAAQINKVTMMGIARFLDNFGPLYGNVLGPKARKQDECTLTATLQAFSLQFAPAPKKEARTTTLNEPFESVLGSAVDENVGTDHSKSSHVFAAAWFNAYKLLMESMHTRSFIHLYAVFLFQMTTVPPEASLSDKVDVSPLEMVDLALKQMRELHSLIDEYCEHLEPRSIYRFLLHSSLSIFNWYAYLRDTIASVLTPRTCILEDAPLKLKGTIAVEIVCVLLLTGSFRQTSAR